MDNQTPFYVSSTGTGLSASIGGFSIVGIAQGLSLVLGMFGHPVSQDSLSAGIVTLVSAAGAVIAAFGVLRKVFFWIVNIVKRKTA